MKTINYKKIRCSITVVLAAVTLFAACVKEENESFLSDFDNNKISLVIADNFNLSAFSAALRLSSMDKVLKDEAGPFTSLAPSDQAFATAGYNTSLDVLKADVREIARITKYHTIDGRYELNRLPFLFNQEILSRGGKMFVTHWIKGADTVLTINGSRVIAHNVPATNGLIQVVDRVLAPYVHDDVTDAIAADQRLTLFYQALKTSNALETLEREGAGPFTIFAPDNAAMTAFGYKTVEQLLNTDPNELKTLVEYHIVKDRRFIYDYILSTGPSNTTRQSMLDGNLVQISLVPDPNAPGSFNSITLKGNGNTTNVKLKNQDILSGNGVLHVVDAVLKIYQ